MTELARRTVEELLVRYELEPALKDVFVEGVFDREVLQSYFRTSEHTDRMYYEIDSVDVPTALLIRHGLSEGNKQRVIALARELAKLSPECAFRCVVDKDLDHWFGSLEVVERLIWTKFCSLELYFFTDAIMKDILITTAKVNVRDWQAYIGSFRDALTILYAMRLADRELGWSLEFMPIDKCLSIRNDRISLEADEYIKRLLMKNQKYSDRDRFHSSITAWQKKLTGDPRYCIRGHDFVELLAWTVSQYRGVKGFASPLTIQRLFVLLAPQVEELAEILE